MIKFDNNFEIKMINIINFLVVYYFENKGFGLFYKNFIIKVNYLDSVSIAICKFIDIEIKKQVTIGVL